MYVNSGAKQWPFNIYSEVCEILVPQGSHDIMGEFRGRMIMSAFTCYSTNVLLICCLAFDWGCRVIVNNKNSLNFCSSNKMWVERFQWVQLDWQAWSECWLHTKVTSSLQYHWLLLWLQSTRFWLGSVQTSTIN